MDTNLIKLFAGHIIVVSEMDKETKRDLLTFVEHASDYQVKYFLLDATLVEDTRSDLARSLVDSKFDISGLPEKVNHFAEAGGRVAKLRKSYMSVYGAANSGPLWLLYRKIRSTFDACTKRCGKYELNTSRRQHGMQRCKADATKSEKDLKVLAKSKRSFEKRGAEVPERKED
jgi:hypothetical protein